MQEEKRGRNESDLLFRLMGVEGMCQFFCVVQIKKEIGGTIH